jgi:hypothetical protein
MYYCPAGTGSAVKVDPGYYSACDDDTITQCSTSKRVKQIKCRDGFLCQHGKERRHVEWSPEFCQVRSGLACLACALKYLSLVRCARLPFLTSLSSPHHDSPTTWLSTKCDVYRGHDPAGTTTCKGRGTNYYGRAYKWEIPEDELPPYVSNPYPNR